MEFFYHKDPHGNFGPLYSWRVVIFGTGAGYCAVLQKIDGLYIKAVRGPLTAAAIGPARSRDYQ
jgi:hypothetical protein